MQQETIHSVIFQRNRCWKRWRAWRDL